MTQFVGSCILGAGLLFLLIGGNVLVGYHYKQRGLPVESGFKRLALPFKDFNAREWVLLGMLAAISLTLAGAGAHLLYG